jgi:hypothetical protein
MAPPVNPRYNTDLIAQRASQAAGYSILVYLPNAIGKAVSEGVAEGLWQTTRYANRVIAEGLKAGVFTKTDLRTANLQIAEKAQDAVVQGWRARLPLKSGPYRRGSDPDKDRLSGHLGRALASSQMISGTTDRGITFLNTTYLAENARHWYRVNYGAFGHNVPAIRRPKAYPVTMNGHTLFSIRDENEPAANSWLPRAFSFQDNIFVPHIGPADKEGGGHRAALFTDLGFQSIADNVGPTYTKMLYRKFQSGGMIARFEKRQVNVQAFLRPP